MFKSLSTSLIVRGILALAVGIIALAWPGVTVLALVILFAVYAFMASGLEVMRAFSSARAGTVVGQRYAVAAEQFRGRLDGQPAAYRIACQEAVDQFLR